MIPNSSLEAIKFLALSHEALIRYLPQDAPDVIYQPSGEGDDVAYAPEAGVRAVHQLIFDSMADLPDDIHAVAVELLCAASMMLDVGNRIDYMWFLDKSTYMASGPYDDGWLVMRRLARLTLHAAGCAVSEPSIPFAQLIGLAGFVRIRIERHPL